MISKITEYLEKGGSYEYGCSLFLSVTTNKGLASRLLINETKSNRELLHYELKKHIESQPGYWAKLVESDPNPKPPVSNAIQTAPSINNSPAPNVNSIRNEVLNKRNELMRERGHLHGRLHEASTNEDRYQLAKEIIEIQPQIDELNNDLKLISSGEIPSRFLQKHLSADEYKQLENWKKYIRRSTSELKTTTDPDRAKILEKTIDKYTKKLKEWQ